MINTMKRIKKTRIVPVIKLSSPDQALPLGKALIEGGLPIAEITFRSPAAEKGIRVMSREFPEILIGAGTVLTPDQADRAISAGAAFIVSPGFNPTLVDYCIGKGYHIIPGIANPGQIEQAIERGLTTLKLFPAEVLGGIRFIKAVSPVYGGISFMPTGGISPANVGEYLAQPAVAACGGSWMVKQQLLDSNSYDTVTALCKKAMKLVEAARKSENQE